MRIERAHNLPPWGRVGVEIVPATERARIVFSWYAERGGPPAYARVGEIRDDVICLVICASDGSALGGFNAWFGWRGRDWSDDDWLVK